MTGGLVGGPLPPPFPPSSPQFGHSVAHHSSLLTQIKSFKIAQLCEEFVFTSKLGIVAEPGNL